MSDDPNIPKLPDVGEDMAPTPQMIVQGKVGNGVQPRLTSEQSKQLAKERKQMRIEIKRSRQEAYEEGAKAILGEGSELENNVISHALALSKRLEAGEALSRTELDTLRLGLNTFAEVKNRAMGKSVTKTEVNTQGGVLHLLMGANVGVADT